MSSFVLTRKFLFFACLRDLRDKVLKRIKKALKSNQKQLDLRAMRHLDIILAKKLVSSICPRDDFGEAKNPYISRLFRILWVIPTRKCIFNKGYFGWFLVRFYGCFCVALSQLSPFNRQSVVKSVVTLWLKNQKRDMDFMLISITQSAYFSMLCTRRSKTGIIKLRISPRLPHPRQSHQCVPQSHKILEWIFRCNFRGFC